jgi:lysophospholipase L1-like esterase
VLRRSILLALLALGASGAPLGASAKIICFGDSITEGYFQSVGYGYCGRLGQRLSNAGWWVETVNAGDGGERTPAGITRLAGQVLPAHPDADFVLLMEGTNDISHSTGKETIKQNLKIMGDDVEEADAIPLHATIIPRYPCATKDSGNDKTGALGTLILDMASAQGRPAADVFTYFAAVDGLKMGSSLWPNYYYKYPDCDPDDPVGHPKTAGHELLTDPFEDAMLTLLASQMRILLPVLPPDEVPTAGDVLTFGASLFRSDFVEIDWDFGDGGRATSTPAGGNSSVPYLFLEPGTYTIRANWRRSGGQTGTVTRVVTIAGPAPAWDVRTSLVPLALRGDGSAPDDLRFDLLLGNAEAQPAVAELRLLEEPDEGEPLPLLDLALDPPDLPLDVGETIAALRESVPTSAFGVRRFYVPASGGSVAELDLLLERFDAAAVRAALEVRFHVPQGGSTGGLSAEGDLYRAGSAAAGAALAERPAAGWSADAREFSGLEPSPTAELRLAATNLGGEDAWITARLFDGDDEPAGERDIGTLKGSTTTFALAGLFPDLALLTGPFRLELDAAAVPFDAALVEVDAVTGDVDEIPPTP